jgi:hypothetical protein
MDSRKRSLIQEHQATRFGKEEKADVIRGYSTVFERSGTNGVVVHRYMAWTVRYDGGILNCGCSQGIQTNTGCPHTSSAKSLNFVAAWHTPHTACIRAMDSLNGTCEGSGPSCYFGHSAEYYSIEIHLPRQKQKQIFANVTIWI